MRAFKIGFIGTGGRSLAYARHYVGRDDLEIVALADPNPHNRKAFLQLAAVPNEAEEFDDWRELYTARDDLDAVVICSPNHVHAEQAVPFLERGLPIVLEKPIAITQADCEHILAAERLNGGRAAVGFVLRSAPFYATIHRLLAQGQIGHAFAFQASELIGWGVSSIINRNAYKRYRETYGSLILSKCCHDLDMLNWMTASRPVAVNSYGRRNLFNPNPALPETCDACALAATCRYYKDPPMAAEENAGDAVTLKFVRDNNRCIYNIDKDVIDTQTVSLEYENGTIATFTVVLNCAGPQAGRSFHAVGSKGRVWGELAEAKVCLYDNETGQVTEHDCSGDNSDHSGGGRSLALELVTMLRDPDYRPIHSARAGYESAIACFAADISRRERRRVDISWSDQGLALVH